MRKEDSEIMRHGMSTYEIAALIGCTRQNVQQIIANALRKLRPFAESLHLEEFLERDQGCR